MLIVDALSTSCPLSSVCCWQEVHSLSILQSTCSLIPKLNKTKNVIYTLSPGLANPSDHTYVHTSPTPEGGPSDTNHTEDYF